MGPDLERKVSNNEGCLELQENVLYLTSDLHVGVRMPYFHEHGTLATWVRCAWCMGTVRLVHGYGALDTWIYVVRLVYGYGTWVHIKGAAYQNST